MSSSKKVIAPRIRTNERFNPQVLRRVFAYLINTCFDGNQSAARECLTTARPRRNPNTGKPVVPFSESGLRKVLKDEKAIDYFMLEAFAHHLEVPTWLILLFSRVHSDHTDIQKNIGEISDEYREEVELNIERTRRFFANFQDLIYEGKVEIEHLEQWIRIYNSRQPSQKPLPWDGSN